jgi:MFS superfamily sulfate permease-like transporter
METNIEIERINTNKPVACVKIERPCYNQKKFDTEFMLAKEESAKKRKVSALFRVIFAKFSISNILGIFTIFDLVSRYEYKKNLLPDILSGLTVGVMHIPAGLAYGALTSLSPVNGLYTSFYCGLVYVFFGTSKHLSVGTYAVTSLMVFSCISKLEDKYLTIYDASHMNKNDSTTLLDSTSLGNQTLVSSSNGLDIVKLQIATALAFWCGMFQVSCDLN